MRNSTRLETVAIDRVRLVNVAGETRIRGAETLLRYRRDGFTVTGSYVFVDAREPHANSAERRRVPLTPKHTAGLVAMWEEHDKGRLGLEVSYTGSELLEDNPHRSRAPGYFEVGLLGEIAVGRARLFLNAENVFGKRQTQYDPLLRRTRAPDGRWTVDVWGPTEGFILNGGIRLQIGGAET